MKQKTLYILRHAKAEAGNATQGDHERMLAERGVDAADHMGKYLVRRSIVPELVLCSTAQRASQTWEHVQQAYKVAPPLEYSERAYLASPNELLFLISQIPESVSSLLIVGHNPGLHQLCLKLAKHGDDDALDRVTLKFPTCAFAAIDLGVVAWSDVARAEGTLTLFVTPKSLENN